MSNTGNEQIDITRSQVIAVFTKGIELIKEKMDVEEYRKKYNAFEDYSVLLTITNLKVLGITTKLSLTMAFKIEGNEPKVSENVKNPDILGECSYETLKSMCRGMIKIKRGPNKGSYLKFSPEKALQKGMLRFSGRGAAWLTKVSFLDDIFGDMQRLGITKTLFKMLP